MLTLVLNNPNLVTLFAAVASTATAWFTYRQAAKVDRKATEALREENVLLRKHVAEMAKEKKG